MSFLDVVLTHIEEIDNMRSNKQMDKDACLDSMRGWMCSIVQRFVCEPYCTSFALPKPSDLVSDEVISKSTDEELARHMETLSRQTIIENE